jgi:hypothetical protein
MIKKKNDNIRGGERKYLLFLIELDREACDNFDFNFLNESDIFFGDKS